MVCSCCATGEARGVLSPQGTSVTALLGRGNVGAGTSKASHTAEPRDWTPVKSHF